MDNKFNFVKIVNIWDREYLPLANLLEKLYLNSELKLPERFYLVYKCICKWGLYGFMNLKWWLYDVYVVEW